LLTTQAFACLEYMGQGKVSYIHLNLSDYTMMGTSSIAMYIEKKNTTNFNANFTLKCQTLPI